MILPSSFRDPGGFLFFREGTLYRQINRSFEEQYTHLINSGLYDTLLSQQLLIPHEIVDIPPEDPDNAYKIIKPLPIPFISYPYEWSFSQLKDAALLTLEIQKISLEYGMILKDATAYNVQFFRGRPVFIDTLSFEKYESGTPWIGYRQFCQHFLAPLALMGYTDIRLLQLLRNNIDGIRLDLTSRLLPGATWLNLGILMHIHLHAKSERNTRMCMALSNPGRSAHVAYSDCWTISLRLSKKSNGNPKALNGQNITRIQIIQGMHLSIKKRLSLTF